MCLAGDVHRAATRVHPGRAQPGPHVLLPPAPVTPAAVCGAQAAVQPQTPARTPLPTGSLVAICQTPCGCWLLCSVTPGTTTSVRFTQVPLGRAWGPAASLPPPRPQEGQGNKALQFRVTNSSSRSREPGRQLSLGSRAARGPACTPLLGSAWPGPPWWPVPAARADVLGHHHFHEHLQCGVLLPGGQA